MKIIFGLSVLLLQYVTVFIYPQEKQLFGMGPFDFNSSGDDVKGIMKEKFELLPGYEKEDAIGFEGGAYFGEKMHIWVFFFEDNKLNEVDLVVKNINRPTAAIFYNIIHNLTDEYGDPDLYQPDEWTAEWFYYDFQGKKIIDTIKVSPYTDDNITTIKISFIKVE